MQFHWLNKQNKEKLIIFFAGWSFDYKPFEFLDCEDFDVLTVYDYNSLKLSETVPGSRLDLAVQHANNHPTSQSLKPSTDINSLFTSKKECYLIAWSMGVFTAYLLKDQLPAFSKKIAVNGTPYPVDDEFGIPQKPFLLTLRHAKTGLEGKFYQNIFKNPEEYERYTKTPVGRTIENRVSELYSLYEKIKNTDFIYEPYYDKAIVSSHDRIIPPKNQMNFWKEKAEIIESGHFPFYNFKSWNEILCR